MAKTAKMGSARSFVPKSVSCDPLFLQAATRRAGELGYHLSGYVRCLIAHDLTHNVVDPDVLAHFGASLRGHDGVGAMPSRRKAKSGGETGGKGKAAPSAEVKGREGGDAPRKTRGRVRKRHRDSKTP